MAEKGHPPRVGAGPAAGSVGCGRDPMRVASGMGWTRRGKRRVGAGIRGARSHQGHAFRSQPVDLATTEVRINSP